MTDAEVAALVRQHGVTGALVRAICRRMGWPRGTGGAPAEWYAAFRAELGDQIERALGTAAPSRP